MSNLSRYDGRKSEPPYPTESEAIQSTAEGALERFIQFFVQNYPSLTIISDPYWHAPRIFRAALAAQGDAEIGKAQIVQGVLVRGGPPAWTEGSK
jgi:hypothetical protein